MANRKDYMPFEVEPPKYMSVAQLAALSPKERYQYQKSLDKYRDYMEVLNTQKHLGHAEGLAKGRAENRAKMIESMRRLGVDEEIIKSVCAGADDIIYESLE